MENIFNEILGMSVDAAWLIAAVIVARFLLHKAPKYFRKILWGLVGLRLLIPFCFESSLSLAPEIPAQTANRVSQQAVAAPVEQGLPFMAIAAVVWLTIGVAFLGYGLISYIRLKAKIFDSVIYKDNIYYSDKIESPFVCGFLKPRIYIPYGLDEETQKCVLQHEKTHIKHTDHLLKAVSFIVLCVHWFNPLVWVSYFLFCKDIELSCDEAVVKKYDAEGCKQYAKALLELGVNKVKFSACPVAFGEVSIKKRIVSVVNYKKAGKVLVCASLCLCVAVAVCFMTEPQAQAKEQKADKVVEEVPPTTEQKANKVVEEVPPTTEQVTEITTEPESETEEKPNEASTVPSTESTEAVTEYEDVAPVYDEELKESLEINKQEVYEEMIRVSQYEFFKYNYVEPTTDPIYEQAVDVGVFVNGSEKDSFSEHLANNEVDVDADFDIYFE